VVRGTWILVAHGALAASWAGAALSGTDVAISWLTIPAAVAAVGTACYTGPLFAQGAGRELWHGWRHTPALLVHAIIEGSAVLMLASVAFSTQGSDTVIQPVLRILLVALSAHACFLLADMFPARDTSLHRRLAVTAIRRGAFANFFWWGVVGGGVVVPALLLTAADRVGLPQVGLAGAAALAAAGACLWHHVWVEAGQSVPLS
jgi:formate-dependent nitrite reductase membrane component NrfD